MGLKMITKPVEQIKQGEFVRRIIAGKEGIATYIRGAYDATYRRYALTNTADMNREIFVKRGTQLAVDFTY